MTISKQCEPTNILFKKRIENTKITSVSYSQVEYIDNVEEDKES